MDFYFNMEMFVVVKLEIDNFCWVGVLFYICMGKCFVKKMI